MKLSEKLKIATQNAHKEIEQSHYFKRLLSPDLTVEEYVHILCLWKTFLTPIEASWQKHAESNLIFSTINQRGKTYRLQLDIDNLGKFYHLANSSGAGKKLLANDFDVQNPLSLISSLYVIEGSTMGAMHIVKQLMKVDFCSENTTHFYTHYGEETIAMWQTCKMELDHWGDENPNLHNQVCDGAVQCFQSLGNHFNG